MESPVLLTAEEFAASASDDELDLRRAELVAGRVAVLEAPDLLHGTVVFNVTKALSRYLQHVPDENGYACFEIGLIVARNPDTVRRPAVSFFVGGQRFAELDRPMTETRPALVIEVASTNDRRRGMRQRVESYLHWGVRTVWVADTVEKTVHVLSTSKPSRQYSGAQTVPGQPIFGQFELPVDEFFRMPE